MATPVWKTYALRPLGFGGVAQLLSWAEPGSDASADALLELRAKVGSTATTNPDSPAHKTVTLPVGIRNASTYAQGLLSGPVVASFFARTASGWSAPVVVEGVLSSTWEFNFAPPKDWVTALLQQLEREKAPMGAPGRVQVRHSFPRDTSPLPHISVQMEAVPASVALLGDDGGLASRQVQILRSGWHVGFSIVLWTDTPEDRDHLLPWFLCAVQALCSLAPYNGFSEPTASITEGEDFSGSKAEKALFMLSCQLTGTMWSSIAVPVHNPVGHITT